MPARPPQAEAFLLPDGRGGALQFYGVQLSHETSQEAIGRRSQRWTELAIYRIVDGRYVAQHVARSRVDGEVDLHRVTIAPDARGVVHAFEIQNGAKKGTLTLLATDAIAAAADRDRAFKNGLGDDLDVDVLEDDDANAGVLITLPRDNDRALRFHGALLAHNSSRVANAPAWLDMAIYRVAGGRFVLHKAKATPAGLDRSAVHVVTSGREAILALRRPGITWLEETVLATLEDAADNDLDFDSLIGEQLDDLKFRTLLGSELRLKPRAARRVVLEHLAGGATLIAQDNPFSLAWQNAKADTALPPPRVFLALSRQRLIRAIASDAKTTEWSISDLGRTALAGSPKV